MGAFTVGDIVLVRLPFTDMSGSKKRPALALCPPDAERDVIICRITSRVSPLIDGVIVEQDDVTGGYLNKLSMVRCNKLYTIETALIERKIGELRRGKLRIVLAQTARLFQI